MTIVVVVMAAALALSVCAICFVLLPDIDNRLGIFVGRDLRRFLAHEIGGVSVTKLVEQRAGPASWSAAHRHCLKHTDLTCGLADGRSCSWEISHFPPRPWLTRQEVYFTPTNRAAAMLIPELVPAGRLVADRFPEQPCAAGAIYDEVEPESARQLFEPFLRKHHPMLFTDLKVAKSERGRTRG